MYIYIIIIIIIKSGITVYAVYWFLQHTIMRKIIFCEFLDMFF